MKWQPRCLEWSLRTGGDPFLDAGQAVDVLPHLLQVRVRPDHVRAQFDVHELQERYEEYVSPAQLSNIPNHSENCWFYLSELLTTHLAAHKVIVVILSDGFKLFKIIRKCFIFQRFQHFFFFIFFCIQILRHLCNNNSRFVYTELYSFFVRTCFGSRGNFSSFIFRAYYDIQELLLQTSSIL